MSPTLTAPTIPSPPLARVIAALDALHLDDGTDAFPPSNLEFTAISTPTNASNVIPGSATAQLNIRFNNLQRGADLVKLVEQIAEREAPGSKVSARISGEAFLTPPGRLYDVVVDAIEEETGVKPELSTSGGTSDGRFLIQLCPVVDFGLPNATMHKVGECAASRTSASCRGSTSGSCGRCWARRPTSRRRARCSSRP